MGICTSDDEQIESLLFDPIQLIQLCYDIYQGKKEYDPDLNVGLTPYIANEITANVRRSLGKKYPSLQHGYSAEKLAGFFCFWISKLKPFHTSAKRSINEEIALAVGAAIIYKRCGIILKITAEEAKDLMSTMRYHTTSPHTLTLLFQSWIKNQRQN